MKRKLLVCLLSVLMLVLPFAQTAFSADDPIDILCVGESLTCGSGANESGTISGGINLAMTYPARLYSKLGYGYQVHNFGISGVSVLPEYKWEWAKYGYLHAAKTNQYGLNPFSSTAPTADIVFIVLGTNDAKDRIWKTEHGTGGATNFYNYYTKIVDEFQAMSTHPQVVCVIPPPAVNGEGINDYEIQESTLRDEISPIIERVAREQKVPLLNLREVFPDPVTELEELLALYAVDDGVHPNKDGYNLIAESMVKYAKRISGDVNESGNINETDISELAKHIADWGNTISELNADVDMDGKVSAMDLALVAKHVTGWDVELY